MAAVRDADGATTMIEWRRDGLVRDSWLRNLGDGQAAAGAEAGRRAGAGDRLRPCRLHRRARPVAHLARPHDAEAAIEDCGRVDLVIARAGPEICRRGGRMLGPWALRDSGGLAITRDGGDLSCGPWPPNAATGPGPAGDSSRKRIS